MFFVICVTNILTSKNKQTRDTTQPFKTKQDNPQKILHLHLSTPPSSSRWLVMSAAVSSMMDEELRTRRGSSRSVAFKGSFKG